MKHDRLLAEYDYDGLGRRIVKRDFRSAWLTFTEKQWNAFSAEDWNTYRDKANAKHYYYSQNWQVLQERIEEKGKPSSQWRVYSQYVWGARGPDDLILRDRDANGDGKLDERFYALSDANGNIISIYDHPHPDSPNTVPQRILERFEYAPYGRPWFMNPEFEYRQVSWYDWNVLFAGYHYDEETGLYHVRNRFYHPNYGRWLQTDPAGFRDSYNLYQYCLSSPQNFVDPTGVVVQGLLITVWRGH